MNTEEQDADPESNDRLIRYLLLRLEDDLHGLAEEARLLTAARRAPGARFFRVRRRFNGGLLDIRYALERHAAATPDRSRTASEGATEGRGVPDTGGDDLSVPTNAFGLTVRCPRCDAASGAGCRAPSGKRLREPHAARRAAAHAAFLDALHPRPDPPWAAFAPFAEPELPTGSSERRRDPHDPLDDPRGDGRRLRHLARGLEEELPELSWYIEERWRMRHKPGVGFPRRCIPLHRGIWEIITTLRRHAEFARGADPLRHVDGDG